MSSILFKTKAFIGKNLTESFYKKMRKRLNAKVITHKDSIDIEWLMIGDGKKPKILFLHGFSDRKENFYFASKFLVKDYDILIPDMPGFGNSCSDSSLVYNLENYEKWLGEFIEKNGFNEFHLVGNSLGGAVSGKLAVSHPERIKSLSLISPAGFYIPDHKSIYDEAVNGINLFQVETADDYENFRERIFYNKPQLPNFVKEFMVDNSIRNQRWYGKIFDELANLKPVKKGEKSIEEISLNSICKNIHVPTMIFWGKHDTLFPYQTANFIRNEIDASETYIFDNEGHCPHLENPKEFSKRLSEFIAHR